MDTALLSFFSSMVPPLRPVRGGRSRACLRCKWPRARRCPARETARARERAPRRPAAALRFADSAKLAIRPAREGATLYEAALKSPFEKGNRVVRASGASSPRPLPPGHRLIPQSPGLPEIVRRRPQKAAANTETAQCCQRGESVQ